MDGSRDYDLDYDLSRACTDRPSRAWSPAEKGVPPSVTMRRPLESGSTGQTGWRF